MIRQEFVRIYTTQMHLSHKTLQRVTLLFILNKVLANSSL